MDKGQGKGQGEVHCTREGTSRVGTRGKARNGHPPVI